MSNQTVALLAAFDALPVEEKQSFAVEILRRTRELPLDSDPLADIANKRNLAWSRFASLRSDPPRSWDENAVSQFHQIVTDLEGAYAVDLSSFRVPDAELKNTIVGASRVGYTGRRRPAQMSDGRYCDEQVARRQLEGIAVYFQNLQPQFEPRKFGFSGG